LTHKIDAKHSYEYFAGIEIKRPHPLVVSEAKLIPPLKREGIISPLLKMERVRLKIPPEV
jgi:hypothetical protein